MTMAIHVIMIPVLITMMMKRMIMKIECKPYLSSSFNRGIIFEKQFHHLYAVFFACDV